MGEGRGRRRGPWGRRRGPWGRGARREEAGTWGRARGGARRGARRERGRGARMGAAAAWRVFKSSTAAAHSFVLYFFLLRALESDSVPETRTVDAASLLRGCGSLRKGKRDRLINRPRVAVFSWPPGATLSRTQYVGAGRLPWTPEPWGSTAKDISKVWSPSSAAVPLILSSPRGSTIDSLEFFPQVPAPFLFWLVRPSRWPEGRLRPGLCLRKGKDPNRAPRSIHAPAAGPNSPGV